VLRIDEKIRNFPMSGKKDIAERLARNIHSLSGLLLINTLQIGKPDSFQFIEGQCHLFKETAGYAARLETHRVWFTTHPPRFTGSGHPASLVFWHMPIIKIQQKNRIVKWKNNLFKIGGSRPLYFLFLMVDSLNGT
jgi:hypothetical protein